MQLHLVFLSPVALTCTIILIRVMPDFPEMRQGRGEKGPDDDVPIDGDAESHRDLDRLLDSDMNAERMAMEARAGLDMQDHDYESASDDDYYSSSFREMGDQEISEVEDLAELARKSIKPGLGPFDRSVRLAKQVLLFPSNAVKQISFVPRSPGSIHGNRITCPSPWLRLEGTSYLLKECDSQ